MCVLAKGRFSLILGVQVPRRERFEVGATERVWVHLDFLDGFSTLGQCDGAFGMCFACVERAARRCCGTTVALRSQDSAWSHSILKGVMKIRENRMCIGGRLVCELPKSGSVMVWESQEVCDEHEVVQKKEQEW